MRRSRRRFILVTAAAAGGAIMILASLALLGPGARSPQGASSTTGLDFVGKPVVQDRPAPAFRAPLLQADGAAGLQDFPGQIVVMNFWASWCTACRAEAPSLESLWRRYQYRGVQFLGIDHNDERNAAVGFQHRFGVTYPSVTDPGGRIAAEFGVIGLPTTFVIDPTGRIRYEVIGRIQEASFAHALDTLTGGHG